MTTYTARWVLPVAGPPLAGGTVTTDGPLIAAVEPHGVRSADVDLGNVAIVPGLVNAHTHLDLSGARGVTPPTSADRFTDWLRSVIAYRRSRTPERVQADVRAGLAECLAAGTTLLGDITAGGASWDAVSGAAVRGVVFNELIGLRTELRPIEHIGPLIAWGRRHADHPTCRPAVSPHAPYSVADTLIRSACRLGLPVTIHWAESLAEMALIDHRTGPFVPFLEELGVWNPGLLIERHKTTLAHAGLHAQLLLAHANYQPADDLFRPTTTIVYCPRTHAAFGHPPHPFRDFLARGVRVCLGTDGLTSNPDLDILAEARFVAAMYPDFPGDQLLRMVTLNGAEALGWADECGSLEAGKSADFVAVPLPDRHGEPHGLLFAEDCGPRRTWFRGTERV